MRIGRSSVLGQAALSVWLKRRRNFVSCWLRDVLNRLHTPVFAQPHYSRIDGARALRCLRDVRVCVSLRAGSAMLLPNCAGQHKLSRMRLDRMGVEERCCAKLGKRIMPR